MVRDGRGGLRILISIDRREATAQMPATVPTMFAAQRPLSVEIEHNMWGV